MLVQDVRLADSRLTHRMEASSGSVYPRRFERRMELIVYLAQKGIPPCSPDRPERTSAVGGPAPQAQST